ncbi:uncharacterized protein LOC119964499 isoform X1 [Scyliorhinus canicula]|uniref:uncharacterized protein LOC119964499 isoform X1 n=1 Tax=Scyliorhinus canicula TaxID=7830 RepID=UPI0018F7400D|nr:uncharacterized protein LOC119964499 isoform X1 [Scyliorhinus canicula]
MIIPNDWVCPFFITFGACMILATVTCCLFHLRKTRNRKKEITEWVNAMKFGGKVYHPLLHWIENNSDLSIKTRVHCSANEECKQRKVWKIRTILPVRYKQITEEPSVLNHEAGDCNSMQIGNKPFPKSPVYVTSGEVSSLCSLINSEQASCRPSLNTEKSQQQVFPNSLSLYEKCAAIHQYVMESDEQQFVIACRDVNDPFSSSDNQQCSNSISTRLSDFEAAKREASTIKQARCKASVLSESNSDAQKSHVYSVSDAVSL